MNAGPGTSPWGLSEIRTTFLTTAVGSTALLVAWWGSSGTGRLDDQVTWTVVGIAGVIVIGVGNFLWLLAARRAVGSRRSDVLAAIERGLAPETPAADPADAFARGADTVELDGSSRYHRPTCLLVQGKATRPTARADGGDAATHPCEMCAP